CRSTADGRDQCGSDRRCCWHSSTVYNARRCRIGSILPAKDDVAGCVCHCTGGGKRQVDLTCSCLCCSECGGMCRRFLAERKSIGCRNGSRCPVIVGRRVGTIVSVWNDGIVVLYPRQHSCIVVGCR